MLLYAWLAMTSPVVLLGNGALHILELGFHGRLGVGVGICVVDG
jgi:hypothetical protein